MALETADPLDLLDHLDSLDQQESLAERSENMFFVHICYLVFSAAALDCLYQIIEMTEFWFGHALMFSSCIHLYCIYI